ncbi:MAG TPA: hypothetical protein IGS17_08705 [Oscillatoriales cyanobacterium M59_W2019_021]|nr:MAG: hypothetical protein D6728_11630 [Cyanobacteria bacterium J055]HIK31580.1 hypothetical protein [Oscillatoriales cyanobacterium M4454_W2019_049]HIK50989.1 hypothetical protein [Oscillatoriales cyanobacterium M59_W2019_021]
MNEPPVPLPRFPTRITILATFATTVSVTFLIAFWVADGWVFSSANWMFDNLGVDLPMLSQLMFVRGGYRFVGLGAIWSGIFCFGAYRHWLSPRLTVGLLMGTAVLTLAYAAIAFLVLCLPWVATMDPIK